MLQREEDGGEHVCEIVNKVQLRHLLIISQSGAMGYLSFDASVKIHMSGRYTNTKNAKSGNGWICGYIQDDVLSSISMNIKNGKRPSDCIDLDNKQNENNEFDLNF